MGKTLDHAEKTLADNYRKEIDQEENVWRSLPFFAAALALQLAVLAPSESRLRALEGGWAITAAVLGTSVLVLTALALLWLARSIAPARFKYVAAEPAVLAYAVALARARDASDTDEEGAASRFKEFLAEQYAEATDNNRRINQRRAKMRTVAGLLILGSVAACLGLALVPVAHQLLRR